MTKALHFITGGFFLIGIKIHCIFVIGKTKYLPTFTAFQCFFGAVFECLFDYIGL